MEPAVQTALTAGVHYWRLRGTSGGTAGDPSGITATPAVLMPPPDGTDNFFGGSVASAGDVDGDGFADVLVGAESSNGGTGRAYVYRGSASGPVATPIEIDGTSDFGSLAAGAGDVNGDGFADILVGAPAPSTAAVPPGPTATNRERPARRCAIRGAIGALAPSSFIVRGESANGRIKRVPKWARLGWPHDREVAAQGGTYLARDALPGGPL